MKEECGSSHRRGCLVPHSNHSHIHPCTTVLVCTLLLPQVLPGTRHGRQSCLGGQGRFGAASIKLHVVPRRGLVGRRGAGGCKGGSGASTASTGGGRSGRGRGNWKQSRRSRSRRSKRDRERRRRRRKGRRGSGRELCIQAHVVLPTDVLCGLLQVLARAPSAGVPVRTVRGERTRTMSQSVARVSRRWR